MGEAAAHARAMEYSRRVMRSLNRQRDRAEGLLEASPRQYQVAPVENPRAPCVAPLIALSTLYTCPKSEP
jgi:hypothetical protein